MRSDGLRISRTHGRSRVFSGPGGQRPDPVPGSAGPDAALRLDHAGLHPRAALLAVGETVTLLTLSLHPSCKL